MGHWKCRVWARINWDMQNVLVLILVIIYLTGDWAWRRNLRGLTLTPTEWIHFHRSGPAFLTSVKVCTRGLMIHHLSWLVFIDKKYVFVKLSCCHCCFQYIRQKVLNLFCNFFLQLVNAQWQWQLSRNIMPLSVSDVSIFESTFLQITYYEFAFLSISKNMDTNWLALRILCVVYFRNVPLGFMMIW